MECARVMKKFLKACREDYQYTQNYVKYSLRYILVMLILLGTVQNCEESQDDPLPLGRVVITRTDSLGNPVPGIRVVLSGYPFHNPYTTQFDTTDILGQVIFDEVLVWHPGWGAGFMSDGYPAGNVNYHIEADRTSDCCFIIEKWNVQFSKNTTNYLTINYPTDLHSATNLIDLSNPENSCICDSVNLVQY